MSSSNSNGIKKLAITGIVFCVALIAATIIIAVNCVSEKESLRDKGIVEYNRGSYEKAEEYFNQSLQEKQWFSSSMDLDTKVYIAESTLKRGDYPRALELFNELLSVDNYPDKEFINSRIEFADAMDTFVNQKDYSSAATKLEKLIEKGDNSLNIYLGACYGNNGEGDKMIDCFNKYTDEFGTNSYICAQLASYYVGIDDYATASDYIQQGIYSGDDKYFYLLDYNKAIILERQKDYEGAYQIISDLHLAYPDNKDFEKEYDFLYSRINIDEEPVNPGNTVEEHDID